MKKSVSCERSVNNDVVWLQGCIYSIGLII